jgi:CRISP-associated protein Cas1
VTFECADTPISGIWSWRAKVDRAVLDFIKGHVFDPADFVIRTDGVVRLNPELARMVAASVST